MGIEIKIRGESGEINWDYFIELEETRGRGHELFKTCQDLEREGVLTKPRSGSYFFTIDDLITRRIFTDYEFVNENDARNYQEAYERYQSKNSKGRISPSILKLVQRIDV